MEMEISVVIALIAGVVSMLIGVITLIMSGRYFQVSDENMHKSTSALESIRDVSNRLDTQISQNFGILVRGALQPLAQNRILKWCVSVDELSRIEGLVEKIVYIHAATMEYETGRFIDVVANNLIRGKKYVYFIPDDDSLDGGVNRFLSALQLKGVDRAKLEANLTIFKVKSGEIVSNIAIFDPEIGAKTGYILPAFREQEDAFLVQLDGHLHDKLYNKALDWEKGKESEKYFPSSEFDKFFKKR